MAITASTYEMDSGRHVVERHTDSEGQRYMQTWFAPSAWTTEQIEARVAEHAEQIETALVEGEIEQLLGEG